MLEAQCLRNDNALKDACTSLHTYTHQGILYNNVNSDARQMWPKGRSQEVCTQ